MSWPVHLAMLKYFASEIKPTQQKHSQTPHNMHIIYTHAISSTSRYNYNIILFLHDAANMTYKIVGTRKWIGVLTSTKWYSWYFNIIQIGRYLNVRRLDCAALLPTCFSFILPGLTLQRRQCMKNWTKITAIYFYAISATPSVENVDKLHCYLLHRRRPQPVRHLVNILPFFMFDIKVFFFLLV